MIVEASRADAVARRQKHVTQGGTTTFVNTYMGTNSMELAAQGKPKQAPAAPGQTFPMAYLVEQAPESTVEPHYHQVDQFQLFVGGGGHIGTHRLDGVTVHYAGAHSPYGPIVSGPAGIHYVTLRRTWDPGAQWMPGAAAVLRNMPDRRHLACTSQPFARATEAQVAALQGASVTELIPPSQETGLGAWLVRAGPDAAIACSWIPGGGQYRYVLAGEVRGAQSKLGADGCAFVSGDEPPAEFSAGPGGAELVVMQFPRS